MKSNQTSENKLENFDSLFVGLPTDIEKNLKNLLPEAFLLENKSIYLQILSQIALAQAMQKKFKLAHKTLDKAEKYHGIKYPIAHARILLERGRIYHQSHHFKLALPYFLKSYQFSNKNKLDEHACNAAHMVAIVLDNPVEQIKWNKKALKISTRSSNDKAREWLMTIYNNLANSYLNAKKYKEAKAAYEEVFMLATEKKLEIIRLNAKWGISKCLRLLHSLDEALQIQQELIEKYNTLLKEGSLSIELIQKLRGPVYEELAEIYVEKAKSYSKSAYEDLSQDPWMKKVAPERLKRMKRLINFSSVRD